MYKTDLWKFIKNRGTSRGIKTATSAAGWTRTFWLPRGSSGTFTPGSLYRAVLAFWAWWRRPMRICSQVFEHQVRPRLSLRNGMLIATFSALTPTRAVLGVFALSALVVATRALSPTAGGRFWPRLLLAEAVNLFITRYDQKDVDRIRTVLRDWKYTPLIKNPKKDNPHEMSAKVRKLATAQIRKVLTETEKERFDWQRGRDMGDNRGTGFLYDPIDIDGPLGSVAPNDALVMIDSDFYVDMNAVLMMEKLTCIYTCLPTTLPDGTGGHHQWIEGDNLHWVAHSGYVNSHPLWDYGCDYVTAHYWFKSVTYRVVKYGFPYGRVMVYLIPVYSVPRPFGFLTRWFDRAILRRHRFKFQTPARKYTPETGELATAEVWTAYTWFDAEKGLTLTVAPQIGAASVGVSISMEAFGKICNSYVAYGHGERVPEHTVLKYAGDGNTLIMRFAAAYVTHKFQLDVIHRGLGPSFLQQQQPLDQKCKCPNHEPQTKKSGDDPTIVVGRHKNEGPDKCPVTVVMQPLVEPSSPSTALAWAKTKDVALETQTERVVKPQLTAQKRLNVKVQFEFASFVQQLLKRIHVQTPNKAWIERVRAVYREKMTKAYEQEICFDQFLPEIEGFLKTETYSGPAPKPNRAITPFPERLQAHMYEFVQALQDALHTERWFAFGTSPSDLASKIKDLTCRAMSEGRVIVETDFSKFDATITTTLRELELTLYGEVFPEHREWIRRILNASMGKKQNILGVRAPLHGSRCTGAPDTCLMNSVLNIFTLWRSLGPTVWDHAIVGGDDGITAIPQDMADHLIESIEECGFSVKSILRKPGEPFTFLARYWTWGSVNSMCDPARLIGKAHVLNERIDSTKVAVGRMLMKIESLLQADGNTPIVGDLLRQRLKELEGRPKVIRKPVELEYMDKWRATGPYPNALETWMHGVVESKLTLIDQLVGVELRDPAPPPLPGGGLPTK